MKNTLPDIKVPIIKNGFVEINTLKKEFKNKKIIVFGVPGAFTPTCSEKHLPGYIKLYNNFKKKNIDDIYCLSVNDEHVMKAWLLSYNETQLIHGIADGNAEITSYFDLITDKSKSYMGIRSNRFAMIIINNNIIEINIENPGELQSSSAEVMLEKIDF